MTYIIKNHPLCLGRLFSDVAQEVQHEIHFSSYGGWPNIRLKRDAIFGFSVTEMRIRAPFRDRPVLQESYELLPQRSVQVTSCCWPDKMIALLGEPHSSFSEEGDLPGSVAYYAQWVEGDIKIGLSVYEGVRETDSGPVAASLYFDLQNEVKAAEPFIIQNEALAQKLWGKMNEPDMCDKFKLTRCTRPYGDDPYRLIKSDGEEKLRLAKKALYTQKLLDTPDIIRSRLEENVVALWRYGNEHFISTRWDTTTVAEAEMSLVNILPAKGPGGMILRINHLQIEDNPDSKVVLTLVERLEEASGIKIEKRQEYDC